MRVSGACRACIAEEHVACRIVEHVEQLWAGQVVTDLSDTQRSAGMIGWQLNPVISLAKKDGMKQILD